MDDDYIAYCLNQAIYYFGRSVDQEMEKAASNAKNEKAANDARDRVLQKILNSAKPNTKISGFADPADMFKT